MRKVIKKDEWFPVYTIENKDKFSKPVDLDLEFLEEYARVLSDFFLMQQRLAAMYNDRESDI